MFLNSRNITVLASLAFASFTKLKIIYLQDNMLFRILSGTFDKLYHLSGLDRYQTLISNIDVYAFNSLYVLKYLLLHGNALEELSRYHLQEIGALKELEALTLYDHP